jgi:hypothetical protein
LGQNLAKTKLTLRLTFQPALAVVMMGTVPEGLIAMVWLVLEFNGKAGSPRDFCKQSEKKWLAKPDRDRASWRIVKRCDHWAEAQELLEAMRKAHPHFRPKGAKRTQDQ